MVELWKNPSKRAVLLMSVSAAALVASFFGAGALPIDPAWVAIVLCGAPILKDAAHGLFTRLDIKADVLVALALIASVAIGELFAGGEVALIMALGSWLEELTVAKARSGLERLANLAPTTARVLRDGHEQEKPADQVQEG